jgi:flagellar biosynthesis GTPase FlhF
MVVPALMDNAALRLACAAVSLAGGVLFMGEGLLAWLGRIAKYPQFKPWWSFAHGGMYLGMAEMYWVHDHVIINQDVTTALSWIAGAFFLWFSGYYAFSLVNDAIRTRGHAKWALYLQSNVAHLFAIGLPMLGMIIWPDVFMPMADSAHQHHHHSAQAADAEHGEQHTTHSAATDQSQHQAEAAHAQHDTPPPSAAAADHSQHPAEPAAATEVAPAKPANTERSARRVAAAVAAPVDHSQHQAKPAAPVDHSQHQMDHSQHQQHTHTP